MSPIIKIAVRRMRGNLKKSVLLLIAILFSTALLSFFAAFEIQIIFADVTAYDSLPFRKFLNGVKLCFGFAFIFVLTNIISALRIYCRIRKGDNDHLLAVLTSIGAKPTQKIEVIIAELLLMYVPAISIGCVIGVAFGTGACREFIGVQGEIVTLESLAVVLFTILFSVLLVLLCNLLPDISLRKRSIVQKIRKQASRKKEAEHGYRQSNTFKKQSLMKKLAQKSSEYYQKVYSGIARSIAFSLMYPILAFLIFRFLCEVEIVLDSNPFDRVETELLVINAVYKLTAFIFIGMLILTVLGIMQTWIISRMQRMEREKAMRLYFSVGMAKEDTRKLLMCEIRSVTVRAVVYLIFGGVILNSLFLMFVSII